MANFNAAEPFFQMSLLHGARPAVVTDEASTSYADLQALVRGVAGALTPFIRGKRVGILGSRSLEACAGVLGTAWAGCTWVPLGLTLPEDRLCTVLELCELDAIVADHAGTKLLTARALAKGPKLIIVPNGAVTPALTASGHTVRELGTLPAAAGPASPISVGPEHLAYIEFTSGTTGVPKGVMLSAGAVVAYLKVAHQMFHWTPEDRIAETCDLTFDVSVSNMFTAWGSGASLHLLKLSKVMNAVKWIQDHQVTVWHSVPSIISLLKKVRTLKPGSLPSLRCSLFIGEQLPLTAAQAWREAAPNSEVHNFYGPTEATVACISEPVTDHTRTTAGRDVVAIGAPFSGMEAAVFDSKLELLGADQPGELVLAGAQLAEGYFRAPELTAARFVTVRGKRWYRTGDLATVDSAGAFHHLGRIDNQVKVRGHRVELEDIEAHLRGVCGTEAVAAVAWPLQDGLAQGVVGFVCQSKLSPNEVIAQLRQKLPDYMVPTAVHVLEALPLNSNDKVDRAALLKRLAG